MKEDVRETIEKIEFDSCKCVEIVENFIETLEQNDTSLAEQLFILEIVKQSAIAIDTWRRRN